MLPPQDTTATSCWLALRLPHLALDGFTRGQARQEVPVAVSDIARQREVIVDCNPAARKSGVNPGMPAGAALGLLDDLRILPRQPVQERETLQPRPPGCSAQQPGQHPG
jgi:hypothetical protein